MKRGGNRFCFVFRGGNRLNVRPPHRCRQQLTTTATTTTKTTTTTPATTVFFVLTAVTTLKIKKIPKMTKKCQIELVGISGN